MRPCVFARPRSEAAASFTILTGIGGVLHDYTADQLLAMYMTVASNRAETKHEANCRSVRGQFMSQLEDRFGNYVERVTGPHGRSQFRAVARPDLYNGLVDETLERVKPWFTRHILAEGCGTEAPAELIYRGDPRGEHAMETLRYHHIIEPQCFLHLTMAWKLGAPRFHRIIPDFSTRQGLRDSPNNDGGGDRFEAPELSNAELTELAADVQWEWDRRGRLSGSALALRVNGKDLATVPLNSVEGVRLDLSATPEIVELVTEMGDRPVVATYLALDGDQGELPSRSLVEHAMGDRVISLVVLQPGSRKMAATVDAGYADQSHYCPKGLAVRSLREEELGWLMKSAKYRMNPVRQKAAGRTWDDLLNEAMLAAMERRPWNASIDPFAYFVTVIRGLAHDWRRKKFDEVYLEDSPAAIYRAASEPAVETRMVCRQRIERLEQLLAGDAMALAVVQKLKDQWNAAEIRDALHLSVRQYETAMKRVRRIGRRAGLG